VTWVPDSDVVRVSGANAAGPLVLALFRHRTRAPGTARPAVVVAVGLDEFLRVVRSVKGLSARVEPSARVRTMERVRVSNATNVFVYPIGSGVSSRRIQRRLIELPKPLLRFLAINPATHAGRDGRDLALSSPPSALDLRLGGQYSPVPEISRRHIVVRR
jgi:hypothetical protein